MEWQQLAFRFVLGGSMVVVVTLVAALTRNAYVAGLSASFPIMLLAGAVALHLAGYESPFIARYFLGTLVGIGFVLVFSCAAFVLVRHLGFVPGIGTALLVWLVLAGLASTQLISRN